jgi:hypothetical protein
MVYQIYDYTIWLIVKIASLLHDHLLSTLLGL